MNAPLRILTWHVHGSYLYYLSLSGHELVLPVTPLRRHPYGGRTRSFPWPPTVTEVPVDRLREERFDVVLFQSAEAYQRDQFDYLSSAQRRLPRIYLEHDPPRQHPTDTRHIVDDPDVIVVHVTSFNNLMWDCGRSPTVTISHGVRIPPHVSYSGTVARGVVVVNNLRLRGRRLGADVFERVRAAGIPLDLVGMDARSMHGLGEVPPTELAEFIAPYRFFFNPIRYTSLGLAVCEAMMVGMPVVGLATTEMATTVKNGVNGYADNDVDVLIEHMRALLADPDLAARLGREARATALRSFSLERFSSDWDAVLRAVVARDGRSREGPWLVAEHDGSQLAERKGRALEEQQRRSPEDRPASGPNGRRITSAAHESRRPQAPFGHTGAQRKE